MAGAPRTRPRIGKRFTTFPAIIRMVHDFRTWKRSKRRQKIFDGHIKRACDNQRTHRNDWKGQLPSTSVMIAGAGAGHSQGVSTGLLSPPITIACVPSGVESMLYSQPDAGLRAPGLAPRKSAKHVTKHQRPETVCMQPLCTNAASLKPMVCRASLLLF